MPVPKLTTWEVDVLGKGGHTPRSAVQSGVLEWKIGESQGRMARKSVQGGNVEAL